MRHFAILSATLLIGCAATTRGAGPARPNDPSSCFVTHPVTGIIPVPVKRVDPLYPVEARQNGVTGEVTIEASIGPDGEVMGARVVESHPPGVFEATSLFAYRQWRYCAPSPGVRYPETFKTRLRFAL